MFKIGIIGGGFAGTLTAVHLIEKWQEPVEITIFDMAKHVTGIAYNAYSNKHLLNVIAGKMSAFASKQNHFVEWVLKQDAYSQTDEALLNHAFLPRNLYGKYLHHIWQNTLITAASKGIIINSIPKKVHDLQIGPTKSKVFLTILI